MAMKRQFITLTTATFLLFQSCAFTIRIPIAKTEESTHNGGKYVLPKFIVEKDRTTPGLITALVFGGMGYLLFDALGSGPKGTSEVSAGTKLFGFALGSGFGLLEWGLWGGFRNPKTTRDVSSDEFDTWLRKYNKTQQDKYVRYREDSTIYLIVPQNKVNAYGAEENRLKNEYQKRIEQMKKDTLAH
jgi:hypothetical protein